MNLCPTCNQEIKPMNPRTLVSVHGYAGDQDQIENLMPFLLHHECPVIVLSPVDSPITKVEAAPSVICRQAGKRAYIGPDSLVRQLEQMKLLLEFKEFDYFLMNDSDSVCLSPKIPDYIYREPDFLWSNEVSDTMHTRLLSYRLPRLAFQPPYFISRGNIEKILKYEKRVVADKTTPFIDWVMMAWAMASGVPHRNFRTGLSCGTRGNVQGFQWMSREVRKHGKVMLHSIKDKNVLLHMAEQHALYNKEQDAIQNRQRQFSPQRTPRA